MILSNLYRFFPSSISGIIKDFFKQNDEETSNLYITLEEIRLRVGKPVILKFNKGEKELKCISKPEDIIETLRIICENSIYSYQSQICNGFITVKGGHRVGITGNVVVNE